MGSEGSCKADGCEKEVVGKGYCARHYGAWKRGEMPKARYKTCKTAGCRKRQVKAAHCEEHQKVKPAAAAAAAAAPPAVEPPAADPPAEAPAESAADG
jgi:hypothetical protein